MFGRRFWGFAAAAVFMLSVISLGATYGGGSGTAEDPYQIWTAEQMNTIGANSADWDKHFKLMDNIDMSAYTGTQYNIIGNATTQFTGTFDGQDHVIHNLTYNTTEKKDYVGLFGYTSGAVIQNLGVENVNLSTIGRYVGGLVGKIGREDMILSCYITGSIHGTDHTGGLVGLNYFGTIMSSYAASSVAGSSFTGGLAGGNYGVIKSCHATGSVTSYAPGSITSGGVRVGGLVGYTLYQSSITFCYATSSVSGFNWVGGLVGHHEAGGMITSCYATGPVISFIDGAEVGGLVGHNYGAISFCYVTGSATGGHGYVGGLVAQNHGPIRSCYSSASVISSSDSYYIGGLVGYHNDGTITNCYATGLISSNAYGGGLVGMKNKGTTISSFWDTQTTGRTTSDGGVGKTTAEMKTLSMFTSAGWDFVDSWAMCEGTNYPRLRWQVPVADWRCPEGVGAEDICHFASEWLMPECGIHNDFCQGADIDQSSVVDLGDFVYIAEQWLLSQSIMPPVSILPAPIVLWKMDETTGTVVSDSVGGHDGQVVNVTGTPWVAGRLNNALKLDGVDDYVDVAGYGGITGTASRTCTAWVKANSIGKEQVILSWGNAVNGQKWIVRVQADGKLAAAVWGGYIQGSISVADGQWHHVAAVLVDDGSPSVNEIRLYVDGFPQTVTSSNSQAINTAASQNVQMGTVYNGTAQASFFSGLLDEVRIYDTALTGEQILRVAME